MLEVRADKIVTNTLYLPIRGHGTVVWSPEMYWHQSEYAGPYSADNCSGNMRKAPTIHFEGRNYSDTRSRAFDRSKVSNVFDVMIMFNENENDAQEGLGETLKAFPCERS